MTTGSRRNSNLRSYLGYGGGTYNEGTEYVKTWTGGDTPPGGTRSWHEYTMSSYTDVQDPAFEHVYIPGVVDGWIKGPPDMLGAYPLLVDPPAGNDSDLFDKIRSKSAGHSFNALVTAGEFRESLGTIVRGAGRIAGALRALRKGNLPSAFQQLGITSTNGPSPPPTGWQFRYRNGVFEIFNRRERRNQVVRQGVFDGRVVSLSETWLDLQYGWKPILNDVYEAGNAVFEASRKPRVARFSASKVYSGSVTNRSKVRFRGVINTRQDTVYVWQEEQLSVWDDLGLTDPASLAWELLPFSFVVDWFIPIGNYLSARHYASSVAGYTARTSFRRVSYEVDKSSLRAASTWYVSGGGNAYKYVSVTRSKKGSISGKDVHFPGFKPWVDSLTLSHFLNATALIRAITK